MLSGLVLVAVGAGLLSTKAWRASQAPPKKNAVDNEAKLRQNARRSQSQPLPRTEVEAARALLNLGEFHDAAKTLTRVLSEHPSVTEAYAPLASALKGLGRSDDAREFEALASDLAFIELEHVHEIESRLLHREGRESGDSPAASLDLVEHYISWLRGPAARAKIAALAKKLGEDHPELEILRSYLDWVEGRPEAAADRLARVPVGAPRVSRRVYRRELWLRSPSATELPDERQSALEKKTLSTPWIASGPARLQLAEIYQEAGLLPQARRQLRLAEVLLPKSDEPGRRLLELLSEPRWAFERLRVLRSLAPISPNGSTDRSDESSVIEAKIASLEARWILR